MAMPKRNYQKEMEQVLEKLPCGGEPKTLLLHACCAPCSSYVLEYLSSHFAITVFYYNPNISLASEYRERADEARRLVLELPAVHPVTFLEGDYRPVVDQLKEEMNQAAAALRFERAAQIRDKIRDVQGLMERQIALRTEDGSGAGRRSCHRTRFTTFFLVSLSNFRRRRMVSAISALTAACPLK